MGRLIIILEEFASAEREIYWVNAEIKFNEDFTFLQKKTLPEIKLFIDSISAATEKLLAIFAHNTDVEKIEKKGKLISECKQKSIPLVLYSGGSNNGFRLNNLLLENLHISVLVENLDSFLSETKKKDSLSSENLGVLVNIDPELEQLLTHFAKLSPFDKNLPKAKDDQGNILKDKNGRELNIKEALNNYFYKN